jgi:NAD(P)-dependent dehydrogenase (short-subunit alcohol dehydrogenase family)
MERYAIVTGSSSGIGKHVAKQLVKLGYFVILACRNKENALLVESEIKNETANGHVVFMQLDLASFDSIRNFVEEYHKRSYPLHLCIQVITLFIHS